MKKLYRSSENRIIAGVCGGIADYFEIDPVLVRLVWVLFIFAGGAGIWAYLVAWLIIPENPKISRDEVNMDDKIKVKKDDKKTKSSTQNVNKKRTYLLGFILVTVGAIFMGNNLFPYFGFDKYWPVIVIAIGLALIFSSSKR